MEALVYDVHGNLPALEAVLDDARRAPTASSSAATTRSSAAGRRRPSSACAQLPDALWIRGNGERWTGRPRTTRPTNPIAPGAIAAAREALGRAARADLAALPGDTRPAATR